MNHKSIFLITLVWLYGLPCLSQEKRVLVIGIDGLLPEAVGTEYSPHINALYEDGAGFFTLAYTEDLTFSGPSWSSILNGVHRDRHGVDTNRYDGHDFSDYPSFLKRLKQHDPELYTAAFVTWPLLRNNFRTPDGTPVGVDRLVYHPREEEGDLPDVVNRKGDLRVTEDLVELLETGDPGAVFYYQNNLDGAGHGYGFSVDVQEYLDQLRVTDARIGLVVEALEGRAGVQQGDEEWLILLVTDHGGVGTGHAGNLYRQRLIPMILNGPAVDIGNRYVRARNVDVCRTVLTYMGVPEEKQAGLDGHDLLAPVPGPKATYGENLIFNGDGEFDRGFADPAIDQVITGWRDQEHTGRLDGYHSMTLLASEEAGVLHDGPEGGGQAGRGSNVFAGSSKGASAKITQALDLGPLRADIDGRKTAFRLSGHLSGAIGGEDRMEFTVYFLDEERQVTGTALLHAGETGAAGESAGGGPVLRFHEKTGPVPPGSESVLFELHAVGASGDGVAAYADRLTFALIGNGAKHEP